MQVMRILAAAAAALTFAWSLPAAAQGPSEDLHQPRPSPETSTGINPATTRGMDRMPEPVSPNERRLESGRIEPSPPVGTTTITAAQYGAETRARPNRTILVTGGAIFLGTYAASAIVGATVSEDADRHLVIPVAGPWMALGQRDCSLGECGFYEDINAWGLIASGFAQAAGLGLVIASLFIEEPRQRTHAKVRVVPMGAGVGALGTF